MSIVYSPLCLGVCIDTSIDSQLHMYIDFVDGKLGIYIVMTYFPWIHLYQNSPFSRSKSHNMLSDCSLPIAFSECNT